MGQTFFFAFWNRRGQLDAVFQVFPSRSRRHPTRRSDWHMRPAVEPHEFRCKCPVRCSLTALMRRTYSLSCLLDMGIEIQGILLVLWLPLLELRAHPC